MKLSHGEAKLFYELMWRLQRYVNEKLKIVLGGGSLDEYSVLPMEEKLKVRDAVYENSDLMDEYISANPDQLNVENLMTIKEWKGFIKGDFYIERHLKNHTIFIGDSNVYGVLGLTQGLDQIFPKGYLPVCTKTVLLPFKGKIIYDGLMQNYNIHFGSGIKQDLNETYMRAKQNEKIICSVSKSVPEQGSKEKQMVVKQIDWSKELEQLTIVSKKLKAASGQPVFHAPIFNLVRNSIELANKAVLNLPDDIEKELRKVKRAVSKVEDVLYRSEDW